MKRRPIALLLSLLAVAGATPGVAHAADDRRLTIGYAHDLLSVHLRRAPMHDVLDEVSRQTGARIDGLPARPGDVTLAFDDEPLGRGLERLLASQSFVLRYDRAGRLAAIQLLPAPGDAPLPGTLRRTASRDPSGVADVPAGGFPPRALPPLPMPAVPPPDPAAMGGADEVGRWVRDVLQRNDPEEMQSALREALGNDEGLVTPP